MNFIISKTSQWNDEKPVKSAKKITVGYWHERTCTEEFFNERFGKNEGLWKSKGVKHQKTHNGEWIKRLQEETKWTIEINTLEELIKFCKKHGNIIVDSDDCDIPSIEIYDDYRE